MVVFVDGKPEKSRYRTYKLQRGGGAAAPTTSPRCTRCCRGGSAGRGRRARRERRPRRARPGRDSPWQLPDLIVVDGGKGQLGMALAAARDVGIDVRAGVGPAHRRPGQGARRASRLPDAPEATPTRRPPRRRPPPRARAASAERRPAEAAAATRPAGGAAGGAGAAAAAGAAATGGRKRRTPAGSGVPGPSQGRRSRSGPTAPRCSCWPHLRDEAHRFAVTFHRSQRRRRTLRSALSDIAGIGATRQRELLRHFGSVRKIREATLEDLAAVPGMSRRPPRRCAPTSTPTASSPPRRPPRRRRGQRLPEGARWPRRDDRRRGRGGCAGGGRSPEVEEKPAVGGTAPGPRVTAEGDESISSGDFALE